ncbi:hypothetical protein [Algivirga pacifica]|uniref:Uncharacterized protein n=1 Tax=Algivirga pacifica TaxID=1162670 RepID=A0ABP9DFT7_9BACT
MKKAFVYIFVTFYLFASIRPLLVVMEDWMAHAFWLTVHQHHHHAQGNDHVLQELKEESIHQHEHTTHSHKKKKEEKKQEEVLINQLIEWYSHASFRTKRKYFPPINGSPLEGYPFRITPPPKGISFI